MSGQWKYTKQWDTVVAWLDTSQVVAPWPRTGRERARAPASRHINGSATP